MNITHIWDGNALGKGTHVFAEQSANVKKGEYIIFYWSHKPIPTDYTIAIWRIKPKQC